MTHRTAVSAFIALIMLLALPIQAQSKPTVVTSFSILSDFAREVAGDHARIKTLAPVGAEVHEYELRPSNFKDLEKADVVFYNGLDLEQWMGQVEATVADGVPVVALAEDDDLETLSIVTGDYSGNPDPHMWMDPRKVKHYVARIADTLSDVAPDHESSYRANAEAFKERLDELHEHLKETLAAIPEEGRTLITSEAAFLYLADAYDFHHDGIWGTNTESEGTSRQMMRIIDILEERQPRAIFWESTISDRYVEGVSGDTGVPVAGPLFVDSLGKSGSDAENYIDMMKTNARVLVEALGDE